MSGLLQLRCYRLRAGERGQAALLCNRGTANVCREKMSSLILLLC